MAITIKLYISTDIVKNTIEAVYALAKNNLHGLYFSIDEEKSEATIIIDDNQIKPSENFTETLQNLFRKVKLDAKINSVNASYYVPTQRFVSYLSMMINFFVTHRSETGILSDIEDAALKSAGLIQQLGEKYHDNWVKANSPKKANSLHLSSIFENHHVASSSYLKDMIERIEEQNNQLIFDGEARDHQRTSMAIAHIKAERNLFSALQLSMHANENNWSEDTIREKWMSYFTDKDFIETVSRVVESEENRIELHVDIKSGTFNQWEKSALEDYYTTVKFFYEQLLAITGPLGKQSMQHYNPTTRSELDIHFTETALTPNNIASFIFDVQLALLRTGLMNQFIVQITHKQTKKTMQDNADGKEAETLAETFSDAGLQFLFGLREDNKHVESFNSLKM